MSVAKSQFQLADFGLLDLTDFTENCAVYGGQNIFFLASDYDSTHSEYMKHV